MGFNVTIVYPVPEIVDWHNIQKGQNPANSLLLCSSFVCSLSCLEGTLCSPGEEPCWLFSWTINNTFKGKSLQQLQWYCRAAACLGPKGPRVSLLLAGTPGILTTRGQVRLGSAAWHRGTTASWQSTVRAAAVLGAPHQVHLASSWRTNESAKRQKSHKPINFKQRFFHLLYLIICGRKPQEQEELLFPLPNMTS